MYPIPWWIALKLGFLKALNRMAYASERTNLGSPDSSHMQ